MTGRSGWNLHQSTTSLQYTHSVSCCNFNNDVPERYTCKSETEILTKQFTFPFSRKNPPWICPTCWMCYSFLPAQSLRRHINIAGFQMPKGTTLLFCVNITNHFQAVYFTVLSMKMFSFLLPPGICNHLLLLWLMSYCCVSRITSFFFTFFFLLYISSLLFSDLTNLCLNTANTEVGHLYVWVTSY